MHRNISQPRKFFINADRISPAPKTTKIGAETHQRFCTNGRIR